MYRRILVPSENFIFHVRREMRNKFMKLLIHKIVQTNWN